jgi:hypothetical protein
LDDAPKDDETKFNETLKRLLSTPPTPHKPKPPTEDDKPQKAKPEKRA